MMTEFEYWILGIAIGFAVSFMAIFIIIHSHVWTKNGYSGLNGKLEDHEVDKFINHVLSEGSFVALFLFCILDPLLVYNFNFAYGTETKVVFGVSFVGSGLYTLLGHKIKEKIKKD